MANRVLLSAAGLKVSRPGINVLTAVENNLLFNSDWSAVAPLLKGSMTGGGTVLFGKTFVNRPLVFFNARLALLGETQQFMNDGAIYELYSNGNLSATWRFRVLSDRLVIQAGVNDLIRYVVWDLNL